MSEGVDATRFYGRCPFSVACDQLQLETNGRHYQGLRVEGLAQDAEVPRYRAELTDAKAYSRLDEDDGHCRQVGPATVLLVLASPKTRPSRS